MDEAEVVALLASLERVVVERAGPETGAPEVAWGDSFAWVVDDDGGHVGPQPFATVVTKDYPGEPSSGLDDPGAFRLNVDVAREGFEQLLGHPPSAVADHAVEVDLTQRDVVQAHPVYGAHGWVCVVRPSAASALVVRDLVLQAHGRALARWHRRAERRG